MRKAFPGHDIIMMSAVSTGPFLNFITPMMTPVWEVPLCIWYSCYRRDDKNIRLRWPALTGIWIYCLIQADLRVLQTVHCCHALSRFEFGIHTVAGINLCMRPANERRRYSVTSSPIGWARTIFDTAIVNNVVQKISFHCICETNSARLGTNCV